MSGYRPIADVWILARAKLKHGKKYYGAYLGGFPERARVILGVPLNESLLHVCGGMAREYPYPAGFGLLDRTLDLDPKTEPDFLQDARQKYPANDTRRDGRWRGILIDPPYSELEASNYAVGAKAYPKPSELLKNAASALPRGGRVGIIHYLWSKPPPECKMKNLAVIGVLCGFNNRMRCFTVWEKQ